MFYGKQAKRKTAYKPKKWLGYAVYLWSW